MLSFNTKCSRLDDSTLAFIFVSFEIGPPPPLSLSLTPPPPHLSLTPPPPPLFSPSWARAGCKKTRCLLLYPLEINFIHSFILSLSLLPTKCLILCLCLSPFLRPSPLKPRSFPSSLCVCVCVRGRGFLEIYFLLPVISCPDPRSAPNCPANEHTHSYVYSISWLCRSTVML